jgi:signal peptide peptidase SppA
MKYAHIVSFVLNTPWAITAEKLSVIMGALTYLAQGGEYTPEEIAAIVGAARQTGQGPGAVAVLPLVGTIYQRANMLAESSGGTSTEAFTRAFRQALADSSVSAIVLDVDSPGGAVSGVDELATEIRRARGQKPIVAVANSLAASAAYWIASAADELVVTPSGEVGSIGVLAAHEDWSKALETQGVRTTLISAGKFKTEGSPYEPLSEEARAAIQSRVDDYYLAFVKAVARNRGTGLDAVRSGYGEGRVVGAEQAVELGMADSIATLDETVQRLAKRRRGPATARAEANDLDLRQRRLRLWG